MTRRNPKTPDKTIKWIQERLEEFRPPDFEDAGAAATVIVVPNKHMHGNTIGVLQSWAQRDGFPLRLPHPSVSTAGLVQEAHKAVGGVLVLDEFDHFRTASLKDLQEEIVGVGLAVAIVGLVGAPWENRDDTETNADALGTSVIDHSGKMLYGPFSERAEGPASSAAGVSQDDLDVNNRHRRQLGMGKLDRASGWSDQELRDMAQNIRTTGRMMNPAARNERLKRKLMR